MYMCSVFKFLVDVFASHSSLYLKHNLLFFEVLKVKVLAIQSCPVI